jgi:citrate lyase synthetase
MRNIIFYLLTFQNLLGLRLPLPDFQLDLRVFFYTRSELKKLFNDCGFIIIETKDNYSKSNIIQKSILKAWGFTDFVLKLNLKDPVRSI